MSTLAEFLLARIAEDEAEVLADRPFSVHRVEDTEGKYWWECNWCADGGWSPVSSAPEWLDHGRSKGHPRMLAECEAKRRIVEECQAAMTAGEIQPGTTWNDDAAGAELAEDTCRLLALPYADHPQFQPEWRMP